jgi:hypothetical protein
MAVGLTLSAFELLEVLFCPPPPPKKLRMSDGMFEVVSQSTVNISSQSRDISRSHTAESIYCLAKKRKFVAGMSYGRTS